MSSPFDPMMPAAPPPEKSGNSCLILGLIFGGLGGFVVLCGGCCFGLMFFAFNEIERQAQVELASNPVVQEHLGEIQTCEIDFMASAQKASAGHENTFVFDVAGSIDRGTVVAEMKDDGSGRLRILSGELTVASGEAYPLAEEDDDDDGAEFARQVREAVAGNAVLAERIGEVQTFTYDEHASVAEPGEDVYVFQVTGDKGSGRLRAESITVDASTESVTSAELVLDGGEKVQLFPEKPLE